MNGHSDRSFAHPQPLADSFINTPFALAAQQVLRLIEKGRSTRHFAFALQRGHSLLEYLAGPLPEEFLFRRVIICRLDHVAFFWSLLIERNENELPPAFQTMRPVPFPSQKVIEHGQQKSAELPFGSVGQSQVILSDELSEEFLRQILGVIWSMTLAAHKNVDRIPISPAKSFQRFSA
jgi:hypothetical protein